MSETPETLGQRIREVREAAGLSRARLAPLVPCDPQTIYQVEMLGKEPSIAMLRRLAAALGTTAGKLLQ